MSHGQVTLHLLLISKKLTEMVFVAQSLVPIFCDRIAVWKKLQFQYQQEPS